MVKSVCIAGAGPGGLLLGKELAAAGVKVVIFEKMTKEAYFKKYNWCDAVELSMMQDAGLPVPFPKGDQWHGYGVIGENTGLDLYQPHRVSELGIYAPDYSCRTVTDASFQFVLTNRTALQKFQTEQTLAAGAKIRYGCTVVRLAGENLEGPLGEVRVQGVWVKSEDGAEEEHRADLVVDASGQAAALRTMLSGAPEISEPFNANRYGLVYRTHRICKTTDVVAKDAGWEHPPMRNHYRLRTPQGYIFFHIHSDRQFDVGGGAATMEEAKKNVDFVISRVPDVTDEVAGGAAEKNVKSLPPDAIVCSGFLVIGHAAAQMHPTHGCGISTAYMGALLAAQILKRALNTDIHTLWEYAHRWMSAQGAHFAALFHRLKNLEASETAFLIQHNILNGETLTNDYNGNYLPPNVNEVRRLEDVYPLNPELVGKWMKSEAQSARFFAHYSAYPSAWSPASFAAWRAGKPD